MSTTPLVLVHGAWLSSASWENFAGHFAERGFEVSAPEWPRKHGDVGELREESDELAGLGVTEIVDHYDAVIRSLPEPPVLMGHSFGGLFVQLLLEPRPGARGGGAQPGPAQGRPAAALLDPQGGLVGAPPAVAGWCR